MYTLSPVNCACRTIMVFMFERFSLYQEVFLLFILSQRKKYLFFYLDHFDLWQLCMRTCIFYLFLRKPFDFGALKKDCMN